MPCACLVSVCNWHSFNSNYESPLVECQDLLIPTSSNACVARIDFDLKSYPNNLLNGITQWQTEIVFSASKIWAYTVDFMLPWPLRHLSEGYDSCTRDCFWPNHTANLFLKISLVKLIIRSMYISLLETLKRCNVVIYWTKKVEVSFLWFDPWTQYCWYVIGDYHQHDV